VLLLYYINNSHRLSKSTRTFDNVCGFLDAYFGSDELVQDAPNEMQKHLRKKWKELYFEDYVPWCRYNEFTPAALNIFTAIRKRARPHYKKSQKMRKRGFDVTTCTRCEMYEALIAKETDLEMRSRFKNSYDYHVKLAIRARRHYAKHRSKATLPMNRDHDLSMAVDAAGGSGTTNFPHYAASAKDEPPRHKLLDIKCTFAKMHGLGTKVYVSFPTLETQGGNLTLEVYLTIFIMYKFLSIFV
jgi:hypothetical protein